MHRLPKTPEYSESDETAPLLHDGAYLTDSDIYATCASGCSDASEFETQNVVQALFSAWLLFPPKRLDDPEGKDAELLGPRAMDAMSLVWQKISAEREVLPDPKLIVQGLAECMVEYLHPMVPEGEEDVTREVFTAYVRETLAESLDQIRQGVEDQDAQERVRKKRERLARMRERLRRRREVEEILQFYKPFAAADDPPPLNCRVFCIFLCQCCSIFPIQFPLHTLLLSWPLSIAIMGAIYRKQCPMSRLMPYVMMAMGVSGTVALLMRLSFVLYETFSRKRLGGTWPWIALKVVEFAVLDSLIIQLYYFFSKIPSFDPSSSEYCNQTFYSFVRWINYVSIVLSSAWVFVYVIKAILWMQEKIRKRVTSIC